MVLPISSSSKRHEFGSPKKKKTEKINLNYI